MIFKVIWYDMISLNKSLGIKVFNGNFTNNTLNKNDKNIIKIFVKNAFFWKFIFILNFIKNIFKF